MKVSFVIVTSSTKDFVKYDPVWKKRDFELEQAINLQTNKLLNQILRIPIDLEVILVDNTNDFEQTVFDERIKVIPGFGYYLETDSFDFDKFDYIDDLHTRKVAKVKFKKDTKTNHTESCSMSFNIGLQHVTGDYIILQHNDTSYLPHLYGSWDFIDDAIKLFEDGYYEFITIDKKPQKTTTLKHIPYFSDAYWFLCSSNFYKKHNIWVDWTRGDTNHLATITCYEKNLPYLFLPGFYEANSLESKAWREYNKKHIEQKVETNIHYLNYKPFLEHHKGGTGLRNTIIRRKCL